MPSTRRAMWLFLALSVGCAQTPPDDDSAGDDDSAEDATPEPVFDSLTGSITYEKTYSNGPLDGQTCTEVFALAGPNVTDSQPNDCPTCDVVYQFYLTVSDDACAGGEDLDDEGLLGFDLRPTAGEAVLWWFAEGWFGSEWTELTTGALDYDTFEGSFDDPDNGSWTANWTTDDPCSWGSICQWNGRYTMTLDLATAGAP